MSRLVTIRSKLAGLRGSRQTVRFLAAMAAVAVAALVALAIFFIVDVAFEKFGVHTSALQRIVLLALSAAGVVWAWRQFASPLLAVEETDLDMALMVERQQQIDSDLVAALQFESPQAKDWGSPQLEKAVVDYVSEWGNGLDVYQGFDRKQLTSRAVGFAVAACLWVVIGLAMPGYVAVFFQRAFLLSGLHYPSSPVIESVQVNGMEVGVPRWTFTRAGFSIEQVEELKPRNAPYGEPLVIEVRVSGYQPDEGLVVLRSHETGHVTQLKLEKQKPGKQDAKPALPSAAPASTAPTAEEPAAAKPADEKSADHKPDSKPEEAQPAEKPAEAHSTTEPTASKVDESVLYRAVLPRLLDTVSYQIYLSDAWTNDSTISIVPLPVVRPVLEVTPPAYARNARDQEVADPASLQRSVLEGSEVRFALTEGTKQLVSATFTVIAKPDNIVIPLEAATVPTRTRAANETAMSATPWKLPVATGKDKYELKGVEAGQQVVFRLPAKGSPLGRISEPVRFEVQAVDVDGLSLESPLRGSIRLKADKKPQISAEIVHKVIVPAGIPHIGLRLRDDYGIRQVKLNIKTVHPQAEKDPIEADYTVDVAEIAVPVAKTGAAPAGDTGLRKSGTVETRAVKFPVAGEQLPLAGTFRLPLASYKLQKGDQIKLTFEAIDERGDLPGEASPSETLVLEVTDVSGVLAAIAEGDERSEKGLTDITNLQLGIGAQK